jgi:hypothetical protein
MNVITPTTNPKKNASVDNIASRFAAFIADVVIFDALSASA